MDVRFDLWFGFEEDLTFACLQRYIDEDCYRKAQC